MEHAPDLRHRPWLRDVHTLSVDEATGAASAGAQRESEREDRGGFREVQPMKKPLKFCCNGDGRPVHPPSWVLCAECFAKLDAKFQQLRADLERMGAIEHES